MAIVTVLSICLQCNAATPKQWVSFTNSHYIGHADGDGDSFRVRSGTNEFFLRLYFVDAPEINLRYPERTREQSEYFGVTLDDAMKGGRDAKLFVQETLREPFTIVTRWAIAGGRSKEPRYYGFVIIGTNSLDELLVSKGLALPKGMAPNLPSGEKASEHIANLRALEIIAKRLRTGLWSSKKE